MRPWPSAVYDWHSTADERTRALDCDGLLPHADQCLTRAIDVAAPARTVFRWLCQLRVAPYSYDWIDNLGRRSPRELTPGLEQLEAGQRFMAIFRLSSFDPGRSITLESRSRLFGHVACTYSVEDAGAASSRVLVRFLVLYAPASRWLMSVVLPPGDLVMMRRQLLNIGALAAADAS